MKPLLCWLTDLGNALGHGFGRGLLLFFVLDFLMLGINQLRPDFINNSSALGRPNGTSVLFRYCLYRSGSLGLRCTLQSSNGKLEHMPDGNSQHNIDS